MSAIAACRSLALKLHLYIDTVEPPLGAPLSVYSRDYNLLLCNRVLASRYGFTFVHGKPYFHTHALLRTPPCTAATDTTATTG